MDSNQKDAIEEKSVKIIESVSRGYRKITTINLLESYFKLIGSIRNYEHVKKDRVLTMADVIEMALDMFKKNYEIENNVEFKDNGLIVEKAVEGDNKG